MDAPGTVLFCFSQEHLVKFGNHVQSQQCMLSFMSYLAIRWVAFFRAVTVFIESCSVTLIYSLCVCVCVMVTYASCSLKK